MLCVGTQHFDRFAVLDAKRPGMHSHVKRGNDLEEEPIKKLYQAHVSERLRLFYSFDVRSPNAGDATIK